MRTIWEARFAQLADGARVLDICTGNGAIALIAAAIAQRDGKRFSIEAIDRATIFPERAVDEPTRELLDAIHFRAGVDAAALPFEAATIDLVTGQFALEYTDRDATIAELARVVAPGGGALFVLHHHDSVILRTAAEERRHIALILDQTALFERAHELIVTIGAVPASQRARLASDPVAQRARKTLNDAAARISDAIRAAQHPEILRTALGYVGRAYESLGPEGVDAALQRLAAARGEIAANAGRLEDLASAALDQAAVADIAANFDRHGLRAETGQLIDAEQRLIGWTVSAARPR